MSITSALLIATIKEHLHRKDIDLYGSLDESTPLDHLNIDSLDMIDIIFQMEDRLNYSFDINPKDNQFPKTIGELSVLIDSKLS